MGWKDKTGTDALDRIVLLLLSLANLAEQAAGRSYSVRSAALAYLWVADAEVRDYIADRAWNETDGHWSPAMPTVRYGTDPADALALAVSLRALAIIILNMATQIRRRLVLEESAFGGGGHGNGSPGVSQPTGREACDILCKAFALGAVQAIDSS
ncbi:hypothetical protein [Mesorhizobium australicum]|uniref:Uncharacterized protein n=1 Tax=Mesorhizobium australicum TaxID=536018 RepID=A0A1X7NM63_9HYPH|nr:hypothetical protein [Mesorhizobium australicum]SMH39071.1 hypothetical protein SAMN02982922_2125 [Mesorhizobium australicum]